MSYIIMLKILGTKTDGFGQYNEKGKQFYEKIRETYPVIDSNSSFNLGEGCAFMIPPSNKKDISLLIESNDNKPISKEKRNTLMNKIKSLNFEYKEITR